MIFIFLLNLFPLDCVIIYKTRNLPITNSIELTEIILNNK